MTTIIKRFEAGATVTPSHTAHLQVTPKDDTPKETITWKNKTYSIKVMKKGQIYHPKTAQEWTALKTAHIAMLDTVNNQNNFEGSSRIRFDSSAKSSLIFVRGGKRNVINLEETFNHPSVTADVKAAYEAQKNAVVTFIFTRFTNTDPVAVAPPAPDALQTPNGTPANTNTTSVVTPPSVPAPQLDPTEAARIQRLGDSDQPLEDADVLSYLQTLQKNHPNGAKLAFGYLSPVNETGQSIPLDFTTPFDQEYIKNRELPRGRNMIFALPYLVDANAKREGHFKLVLIDFDNVAIYHYDSLGNPPTSEAEAQLNFLLDDLDTKYPDQGWANPEFEFITHEGKAHQTDGTSCGHFVLACVQQALNGDAEKFLKQKLPTEATPQIRTRLAAYYQNNMTPAPSSNSSITASTTTMPASAHPTTGPVTTPPATLTSFAPLPEDDSQESTSYFGRMTEAASQKAQAWFWGMREDD